MIQPINYNDLPTNIIKDGERQGLTFLENTSFYGYYIGNELVGCCAILSYKNKVVFKSMYVLEQHRRKGIYKELMRYMLKEVNLPVEIRSKRFMTAYLQSIGFTLSKQYKYIDLLTYAKSDIC